MLRKLMALALAATTVVALAGCGAFADALAGPVEGSCVAETKDGSFDVVECDTAELKVLKVIGDAGAKSCVEVAGVTASYSSDGSETLCIGPTDADPDTAINVAQKDDCVTGTNGDVDDVERVACDAPEAEAVVLEVVKDAANVGLDDGCSDVPGTRSSYAWSLNLTGDSALASLQGYSDDLLFCLGAIGVDPQAAVELARAGDCLTELPDAQGYAIVDCGSPEAVLKVIEYVDSGILDASMACRNAEGATSGIEGGETLNGWVLCVADV